MFFDEPLLHERILMQAERRGLIDDPALEQARSHSQPHPRH